MKTIVESPAVLLLTLVGTLLAIFSKSFSDLSPQIRIGVLLFAAFLAYRGGATYLSARKYRNLPKADPALSPFAHQPGWQPWPRQKAHDLSAFIEKDPNRHTLLIAPSGAGKSILTNRLLPQLQPNLLPKIFEEYHEFLTILGLALSEIYEDREIFDKLRDLELKLRQPSSASIDDDLTRIGFLLRPENTKHDALIVFDQAERLTALIRKAREAMDGDEIYARVVRSILSNIRLNKHIRVIFSIRSTNLFESLVYIFGADDDNNLLQTEISVFYLWGLNGEDDGDFYRKVFKDMTDALGSAEDFDKVLAIANFRDKKNADSFGLRLAVYLFSIISERGRPILFKRIHAARHTSELIDVMFDAAYEHHARNSEEGSERALFDIVVFALAAETKASGSACSLRRLALLAHYPLDDVEGVIQNLCDVGLIKSTTIERAVYYRFAHDSIADYIFQDEGLNIHSRAIDAIRSLTEASIDSNELVEVTNFPSAIERNRYGWRSVSYVAVVMFAIFGLVRIAFPDMLYQVYVRIVNPHIAATNHFELLSMPAYYVKPIMYVPHYIVHILWVSYIDRMNRSFIQYVGSPVVKFLSNLLSPLGVVLGICVAFTPQLFVVPIVAVGFFFGIALYTISRQPALRGEIKEITAGWGFRSSVNVVVVLLLALLAVPLYSGSLDLPEIVPFGGLGSEEVHLGLIVLEAFALYWFWMHIRDEQNRRKVWAANLGLFDKGRMGGAYHHE